MFRFCGGIVGGIYVMENVLNFDYSWFFSLQWIDNYANQNQIYKTP